MYIVPTSLRHVCACNAPINVGPHPPHPGQGGKFSLFGMADLPRGRDIESLKCACAIRIVRVRGVQYSAVPCHASLARVALCPYSSTLFDRRYVCSSLLCWSSTRGYLLNTYGEENPCHRRGRDLNLNVARWVGQLNSN